MWLDCQLSVYISYIRYKLVSDDLWYSAEGARELVMILDESLLVRSFSVDGVDISFMLHILSSVFIALC